MTHILSTWGSWKLSLEFFLYSFVCLCPICECLYEYGPPMVKKFPSLQTVFPFLQCAILYLFQSLIFKVKWCPYPPLFLQLYEVQHEIFIFEHYHENLLLLFHSRDYVRSHYTLVKITSNNIFICFRWKGYRIVNIKFYL